MSLHLITDLGDQAVILPLVLATGLVLLKMLPFDNKSEFQVVVDMPVGTPLEQTAAVLHALGEHLARKYGSTPEQQQAAWQALRERAAAVGFEFRAQGRGRIWNTFDAHRLLHWAGLQGAAAQTALKVALLRAYFGRGENPSDAQVLLAAVAEAGLELDPAREILAGDRYADAVREREQFYTAHGIQAVPSVIVNDRHLIQGGQPPEVFEQALRQIAAQAAKATPVA